jgi:dTDP-4-amino-4,6-dideoxygalactose transaminase
MIPFNKPHATGREFGYIQQAIDGGHLSGNGPFDRRCGEWLEHRIGCRRAFLTASGTSALEMAMLLADLGPGDEVLLPSFTFVTAASAVALRGATPVFVDIRPDTLNLDERAAADAVTERTRAIVPVHYAGVGCAMDELGALAARHGLQVIEDAAHGIMSSYRGRPLGSFGRLGCLSFHETKNVTCGEGGALLVNDDALVERAEIVQEKGTDRSRFFRGQVDRYTWVELGSSFLASEVSAAFLWAQLEEAERITADRMRIWDAYHERLAPLEDAGLLRRPVVPEGARHNAHMYHVLLPDRERRDALISDLATRGVHAVFHYVPLHDSPAGRRYGRAAGPLPVTDDASGRLVRLPLWADMGEREVEHVSGALEAALRARVGAR